jgi:hypothetical protein
MKLIIAEPSAASRQFLQINELFVIIKIPLMLSKPRPFIERC